MDERKFSWFKKALKFFKKALILRHVNTETKIKGGFPMLENFDI